MQRKPAVKNNMKSSSSSRWLIGSLLLLVGLGGTAAAWYFMPPREDPEVTKAKELQQQLFRSMSRDEDSPQLNKPESNTTAPPEVLTPQKREEVAAQFREQMESLTDEQRREVMEGMRDTFRQRMRETIEAYHALPEGQRTAFLDKEIDRWEKRRAEFERNRANGGSGRGGPGSGGGPGRREGNSSGGNANGGNANGGNAVRAAADDGGRRGPPSAERRLEWRREMLGNTTPKERAQFANYMEDINARRKERGLEPAGPGRR